MSRSSEAGLRLSFAIRTLPSGPSSAATRFSYSITGRSARSATHAASEARERTSTRGRPPSASAAVRRSWPSRTTGEPSPLIHQANTGGSTPSRYGRRYARTRGASTGESDRSGSRSRASSTGSPYPNQVRWPRSGSCARSFGRLPSTNQPFGWGPSRHSPVWSGPSAAARGSAPACAAQRSVHSSVSGTANSAKARARSARSGAGGEAYRPVRA
ncbi:hypothetical protein [Streptomyces sp. NPDC056194]|uniref:hypothetical protein n=1 Tax=unclassified Streptomyces TaxID=2593676 RepID=UPI0035E243DE